MKAMIVGLLVVLGAMSQMAFAQTAEKEVVFSCDLDAGKSVMLTRDPKTDTFTLKYGASLATPEVVVIKLGNDMGTTLHYSRLTNTEAREVYMTKGEEFYTVGYVDGGAQKQGYVHITRGTVEVAYQECNAATLNSTFGDVTQFANFTEVD